MPFCLHLSQYSSRKLLSPPLRRLVWRGYHHREIGFPLSFDTCAENGGSLADPPPLPVGKSIQFDFPNFFLFPYETLEWWDSHGKGDPGPKWRGLIEISSNDSCLPTVLRWFFFSKWLDWNFLGRTEWRKMRAFGMKYQALSWPLYTSNTGVPFDHIGTAS